MCGQPPVSTAEDPLGRQHAGAAEEARVLGRVDVVRDDADAELGAERAAERGDQRALARPDRAADPDAQAPVQVAKSLPSRAAWASERSSSAGANAAGRSLGRPRSSRGLGERAARVSGSRLDEPARGVGARRPAAAAPPPRRPWRPPRRGRRARPRVAERRRRRRRRRTRPAAGVRALALAVGGDHPARRARPSLPCAGAVRRAGCEAARSGGLGTRASASASSARRRCERGASRAARTAATREHASGPETASQAAVQRSAAPAAPRARPRPPPRARPSGRSRPPGSARRPAGAARGRHDQKRK